jgi:hypothetical protein
MNRRLFWSIGVVLAIGGASLAIRDGLQAQTSQTCFAATSFCIEGRFREFWEQNGALPVFGFTIAPQQELSVEGGYFLAQWLERSRFELHPENAPPYDILLGRLGDDRLRQLGRDWQAEPRASGPQPGCLWFAQTQHNVCNQANGVGFLSYWRTHGLLDPQLDAYGRSLALFGLPLTEPTLERNAADGQIYLTQWFERARFEWHPNEPNTHYKVLLGLLGNEMLHSPSATPTPPKPTAMPTLKPPTPTQAAPKPTSRPPPKPTPKAGATPPPRPTYGAPKPTPVVVTGTPPATPTPTHGAPTPTLVQLMPM